MTIVNVDQVTTKDLMYYADKLTGTGAGYKTIESFMSNYIFGWAYSESGKQICEYLKATMYFDEVLGMWLEI